MTVSIEPSRLSGTVEAPPSKSMAHRLLICAGLAKGESVIGNVAFSEDILATLDVLRGLSAGVRTEEEGVVRITGCDPFSAAADRLFCRESGSTLRFFCPLCMLSGEENVLFGAPSLMSRPLNVYEELFAGRGLTFLKDGDHVRLKGPLSPGVYEMDGGVSSQFVSGLLFALPLLEGESVVRLKPPVESLPYIDMTVAALGRFGVKVIREGAGEYVIPGGQRYQARDMVVEGDWSNAAFLLAAGLDVSGLDRGSLQGDKVCEAYFGKLGEGYCSLPLNDCPDLGPVMFAYAAMHNGGHFTGTRRLRIKESDRVEAMRTELLKFGVGIDVKEDEVTVGCGVKKPSVPLYGHNDHRIVMALALLCAKTGGVIEGAEAVKKSFPDFFEVMRECGLKCVKENRPQ